MSETTMLEQELRGLAGSLIDPKAGECLVCYVSRMVEAHGCSGLRWALHYRDQRAPQATAIEQRLGEMGGYCDCEILMNAYEYAGPTVKSADGDDGDDGDDRYGEPPDPFPDCERVPRGSTQPCTLWRPQVRSDDDW